MAVSQTLSVTALSTDVLSNTSTVRILWQSTQTGESWNGYQRTAKYYISINGFEETEYSVTYTLPQNATKTIVDRTITVSHRDNGTAEVFVRTWMDTKISAGVVEKSSVLELDTIPRASSIKSVENKTLGENCHVTWTPLSADFTYKLNFSLGSWSHTTDVIRPQKTTLHTYTDYQFPLEIAQQLPRSAKGTMTVILATFEGTKQVGADVSATFTITVPNNEFTQPTVDSMSLSPVSSLPSPYNGLYIQGYSKVKASLKFGTKYGATVTASNISVSGNNFSANFSEPYESGYLSQAGKATIKATVKDSRGFYGTRYQEIEVIPYGKPYVCAKSNENSVIAARCDASANFTDSGTYLKIKAKAVYSKVISDGKQYNYGLIKIRYRKEGGAYSDWQTIHDCKATGSDEVITPPLLNGTLSADDNYQVQIIVSDGLYDSAPVTFAIASEAVYMDRPAGGKSIAFGGYSTGDGRFDVYWNLIARAGLSLLNSKGDLIPLDSSLPIPSGQLASGYNPDSLSCGIHVVANNIALKSGDSVIMYNGVIIQMEGQLGGNVKIQLALPVDEGRNPMYRICWYSTWTTWRSMKL